MHEDLPDEMKEKVQNVIKNWEEGWNLEYRLFRCLIVHFAG
jgi:hypothetical protein